MSINKTLVAKSFVQAIEDFRILGNTLLEKHEKPYLALNTNVIDTKALLISLLLYLEGKNPYYASAFHEEFFISQLRAIYRYFMFTLQIAIQAGLNDVISQKEIVVGNGKKEKISQITSLAQENFKESNEKKIIIKFLQQSLPKHPEFNDYLNALLNNLILPNKFPAESRKFFQALSLARNKTGHFNETIALTNIEKKTLNDGHLGKLIGKDGSLVMDVLFMKPILNDVIKFFDIVTQAKKKNLPC